MKKVILKFLGVKEIQKFWSTVIPATPKFLKQIDAAVHAHTHSVNSSNGLIVITIIIISTTSLQQREGTH